MHIANLESSIKPVVLVIDDDQNDRELTTRFLKKHMPSVQIEICTDGNKGLAALESYLLGSKMPSLSLVMLDLRMPGMNGDVLMQQLAAHHKEVGVPVILFSSSATEEDVARCTRSGVKSYVRKPVDFHEYDGAIRQVCEHWISTVAA